MSDETNPPIEAPKRGRKPGFIMTAEHRSKIANSQVLNRLLAYVEGDENVKMEAGQVTAALGLLKKVLPDLQTTTIQGDEEGGPLQVGIIELVAGERKGQA
jgi:hypothetical protein